ncbi:MAG TPA: phosphocholine cytidylyltransferase family protein [Candidatus Marinimicrobia bacterium]|nr:phosphocholine cytidylyltransferase family protein [Candidatus Neomarinimicrobiota bacterium]HRS52122.1 phosphocholine cytidylyltransferase family protein [Candidatus Neomarinimicrobiota bacterium]HRU92501.1 phosphocholine cytidylyltransferase family protein [Candidatus Neomarinimicrobiota bacterium]
MKAVILAAGAARRLAPMINSTPKCLIKIRDKSLLEKQLDALQFYGIEETLIVVGYLKEQIIEKIGNRYKTMNISYVENPLFGSTNTVYSLWLAREYFANQDFLYFNADVLFHHSLIGRLLEAPHETAMGVEVKHCGEEEVKVIVDDKQRIRRIGKKINPADCLGEFVGIAKFGASLTADLINALKAVIDEGQQMSFFEAAVDRILDRHALYAVDISQIPVIEIDFPEDLERARQQIYPKIVNFNG